MSQSGSKIILFCDDALVSILRDDVPDIVFPNMWDLPGGGIETGETPVQALLREVDEELGLVIDPARIVWEKTFPFADGATSYLYAAPITRAQVAQIRLGDEGQRWELMKVQDFCTRADAVPHFQPRVAGFMAQRSSKAGSG